METVDLVVGTNVAIDQYPNGTLVYVGTPYSQPIVTKSTPTAKLSATGLPPGITLHDNGDGTGSVSGVPTAAGSYLATFTANDVVESQSVNTRFLVADSTPQFVAPQNGQTITVYSGTNGDPRNTIPIRTNAHAPLTLSAAATSANHFTFFE